MNVNIRQFPSRNTFLNEFEEIKWIFKWIFCNSREEQNSKGNIEIHIKIFNILVEF